MSFDPNKTIFGVIDNDGLKDLPKRDSGELLNVITAIKDGGGEVAVSQKGASVSNSVHHKNVILVEPGDEHPLS